MISFRALFYGCWRTHDLIRARTATGEAIYACQACGEEIPVLQTETVKGPQFHQAETLGTPKTTTFRETAFTKRKVG